MEYRYLGKSGLRVSALSLGSWVTFGNQVDVAAAKSMFKAAYDAGINFFDNAEVYAAGASEEIMGKAISELGWSRDSYCVSSKVFWGGDKPTQRGLSRKHIFDACHAALKRSRVDYLDLFFCHRPDLYTPLEETVRAMSDLVTSGKVMYWGTSEWSAARIAQAYGIARQYHLVPPVMEQPQYNMLHRDRVEAEYAPLYQTQGLGTTIWSPLASGILTGKYSQGVPEGSRMTLAGYEWLRKLIESEKGKRNIEKARGLEPIARELGVSLAELAIAWCLKNPQVSTVILGASKLSQLEQNLKAMACVPQLSDDIMMTIDSVLENKPKPPIDWLN